MKIGVMLGGAGRKVTLEDVVERACMLERRGFDTAWVPNVFGLEAVTLAALIGRRTQRIEVGTAIVPTQPRHPAALAQQALTAGVACDGRFTLGIGLSHPVVVETMLGLSYARRAAHMREYVAVLGPLLRAEPARFEGAEFRVSLALDVPEAPPVPLLIAALGERMLEIAGKQAAGTILWTTGPKAIESHIAPKIREAARVAGRPAPRIVAGLHIVLASAAEVESASAKVGRMLAIYAQMPSYKAMLELEGTSAPAQLALIGDERTLDASLDRLHDIGVSDFEASIVGLGGDSEARTLAYLESRIAR